MLYDARAIDDLQALMKKHGDWMELGNADEQKEAKPGTDPPKDEPVTKTITVGKVADEATKGRYATLGTDGAVFVVAEPFIKAADRPALDLLEKSLLSLDPTRVSKVQLAPAKAAEAVTLVKDDKGVWMASGMKDGKAVTVALDYQGNVVAK